METKLIDAFKKRRKRRKEYKIKPMFKFVVDTEHYDISILPTIFWQPWRYRDPYIGCIIEIWWLNFHILMGEWTVRGISNEY